MLRTCFSTVPSVTHSLRAMPALDRPSAINPSTSMFARRQHCQRIVTAPSGHQLLHHRRVNHRRALCYPSQGVDKIGDIGDPALEQISDAAATGQQLHRMLDVDMRRQHQNPGVGQFLANHPGCLQALGGMSGRHPDIHHHHIGAGFAHQGEQLDSVADLADDGEPRAVQQAGQTFAQEGLVVSHHRSQRSRLRA